VQIAYKPVSRTFQILRDLRDTAAVSAHYSQVQAILKVAVLHRYETISRIGDRPSGVEDHPSHVEKGVAGEWQIYFTPPKGKEQIKSSVTETLLLESDNEKDASC
jgi:hypothetical protein